MVGAFLHPGLVLTPHTCETVYMTTETLPIGTHVRATLGHSVIQGVIDSHDGYINKVGWSIDSLTRSGFEIEILPPPLPTEPGFYAFTSKVSSQPRVYVLTEHGSWENGSREHLNTDILAATMKHPGTKMVRLVPVSVT